MARKIIIGNIFDSDSVDFLNGFIVIEGEKIIAVDKIGNMPEDFEGDYIRTDGYVIPGLIEGHNHLYLDPYPFDKQSMSPIPDLLLRAVRNAKVHLHDGVTAMRECGTPHYLDIKLKEYIDSGDIEGPKLLCAGQWITASHGHGSFPNCAIMADGEWEIRKAVRKVIREGAEFIKIMVTGGTASSWAHPLHCFFSPSELMALVDEAHAGERMVSAHCHGGIGVRYAVDAGIDILDHGAYITDDSEIELIAKNDVIWSFNQAHRFAEPAHHIPDYERKKVLESREKSIIAVQKALKAGIRIIAGADGYHADSAMVWALEGMIKSGANPAQALLIGTKNPGEFIYKGERGALAAGKYADIIISKNNPLENISHLRKLAFVMKEGKIIKWEKEW
jgi:imidazolonepropionase-like amidohydrolase